MLSHKLTQHTHTHTKQRSYAEAHARVAPQSAGCIYYGSALPILSTPVQPPSNSNRPIRDGSRFCVGNQCRTNSSYFGPCQYHNPKHLSNQLLNYLSNWSGQRKAEILGLACSVCHRFPRWLSCWALNELPWCLLAWTQTKYCFHEDWRWSIPPHYKLNLYTFI